MGPQAARRCEDIVARGGELNSPPSSVQGGGAIVLRAYDGTSTSFGKCDGTAAGTVPTKSLKSVRTH